MDRLQKLLSAWGVCSRREAERLILAGRVSVNGQKASLGQSADPSSDLIEMDGKAITHRPRDVYIILNKPAGYVTTLSDERGRKCVKELVKNCGCRVYPVGRLDMYSEGLLLFTNDGQMANIFGHPSNRVEKEYLVRVKGDCSDNYTVLSGPFSMDGSEVSARVELLTADASSTLLSVTLSEGKNREIRRMCAASGLHVLRIRRVREGNIRLGDLKSGCWRYATPQELEYIKNLKRRRQNDC